MPRATRGSRKATSAPGRRAPSRSQPREPSDRQRAWSDAIWQHAKQYHVGEQTESSAFLRLAVEAVYRLEDTAAADAICDGGGDKGIDAIVVDEVAQELIVLQAKWRKQHGAEQGDADLKSFMGVQQYFDKGPSGVDQLLASKPNPKLISLLSRLEIKDRLRDGYKVRFRLLTNGTLDASGRDYLQAVNASDLTLLDVLDLERLGPVAELESKPGLLQATFTFATADGRWLRETLEGDISIVVASVSAKELVNLPGIDDRSVFDMNVRFGLSERTRVNRELAETIAEPEEHSLFLAYHNGLTILCDAIAVSPNVITITNFSVANGCQSLLGLRRHAGDLTDSLRLLVRFVDFNGSVALAQRITYRTNNQNPINMRDLRANDGTQRLLKAEFARYFASRVNYQIKSGAPEEQGIEIANDIAAQLLMAFYVQEPWNAVRRLVLFDEQYNRIFSYNVHAQHIFLAYIVLEEVEKKRGLLNTVLSSNLALLRIVLVYLVSVLLDQTEEGNRFKADPLVLLLEREAEVREALSELSEFAIDTVNEYVEDRVAEVEEAAEDSEEPVVPYDYKTALKSRAELRRLAGAMTRRYRRVTRREQGLLFTLAPRPRGRDRVVPARRRD
jgi:AIPR protein